MTYESTPETLQQWWDECTFSSKGLYQLKENGDIVLQALGGNGERTIATVAAENAEIVLKALLEKFPEVEAKIKELQQEWDSTADKLKLAGKVERIKDYLMHANAIGDFDTLVRAVIEMEQVITRQVNENYEAKLKLVQQAESLTDSEDWKETSQVLRDLTDQWKELGYTDKERNDVLWERLEAARTKFFDRKRSHQEDVNKEMLANLDIKIELVDKAEKLAASDDWKATTEAFKSLMDEWKKTGPTMHDKNEALWSRFIMAKNTFFDRKKQNFETIQQEQETNYAAKLALVEKAEAMKENTEWNKTTTDFSALMDEWKSIGRVPSEKSDELWNRLNAAKDVFFNNRRQHFETVRVSLEDNMAMKQALIKRAEALQNSTRWHEATEELNELMDEWKKTGPVPREHSKKMWDQFLAARKTFFERKDSNREYRKQKAERKTNERKFQLTTFLKNLEAELKEEQEKLEDFKNGLQNITPGRKAEELRNHLEDLIKQTERIITSKQGKIETTKKQIEESENKQGKVKEPAPKSEVAPQEESADNDINPDTESEEAS